MELKSVKIKRPTPPNVASNATPGQPNRKQHQRLARRIAAWSLTMNSKDALASKKELRKGNGGYKKPGSMQ
jgi:hypothetical protein